MVVYRKTCRVEIVYCPKEGKTIQAKKCLKCEYYRGEGNPLGFGEPTHILCDFWKIPEVRK